MPDSPVIETIDAAALGDRLARLVEHRELAARPTSGDDRAHLGRPARARHAAARNGILDSAQLDLAERLELDAELHLALGLRTDHDAAVGASCCSREATLAVSPSAL